MSIDELFGGGKILKILRFDKIFFWYNLNQFVLV